MVVNPWRKWVEIGDAVNIYALLDADTGEVRYVGKTIQRVRDRYTYHLRAATRGSRLPVHRWIRKRKTEIKIIEVAGNDWAERERFWIAQYRRYGRLLNLTDGGDGLHGLVFSDEHKAKISHSLKRGSTFHCEVCGVGFWRKPRDIKKGDSRFCSRSCYFIWQRGKTKKMPGHSAWNKGLPCPESVKEKIRQSKAGKS